MAKAAAFLVLLLAVSIVHGADHIVGGNQGWSLQEDYSSWAAAQTFTVGDNLVFNYDSSHKVDVVNENDYKACTSSNVISSHGDGNTKIPLSQPGKMYFICPVTGHCSGGMKMEINVVAASTTPSGTPATPSPPSSSETPGTTTASPPPPPADNDASSVFGASISFMLPMLVSGAIAAFLG